MTARVKYIGTAERFWEASITGQQQVWHKGEMGEVSDANAALLVAAGQFAYVAEATEVGYILNPAGTRYVGRVEPDGTVTSIDPSSVAIGRLPNASSIGTRIFGGRMENDFNNTANNTWEVVTALSQEFDAVRVIFANSRNSGGTTASPTMLASVAAVPDSANATADAATWTSVTVGASGTWALTAASAQYRRSLIVSDWIGLPSTPRMDGGSLPLIAIRAWVNGGNPITLIGNGSTDVYTNWATKPDGRIWKMRRGSGNFASTSQTTFSGTAVSANESPIIGVQYAARGRVVTVMTCGDSIYEGRGTYINEGFVAPAAWGVSSKSGVACEYANLSWSGASMTTFENSFNDAIAAGVIPDILVFPAGSPNDIASTIGANNIAALRLRVSRMLATCRTNRVVPVLCSWMPTNTAIKAYGATDSLREAFALDVESRASLGLSVAATATAVRGSQDGSSQYQMLPAYTTDGIHPNDAGNTMLAQVLLTPVQRLVQG